MRARGSDEASQQPRGCDATTPPDESGAAPGPCRAVSARRDPQLRLVSPARPRLLFVAEEVTLAHVGRMIALASSVDGHRYDVRLACGERYADFVRQAGIAHVPLRSMSPTYFAERLAAGRAVHTGTLLEQYVEDDLVLLEREQPDLVVGDFRVSLGISSELARVPFAAVTNAYWSPASTLAFPMPEHPLVHLFGLGIAGALAKVVKPLTFKAYLRPFNLLRRRYGLPPVASLLDMYCHGTWTLYPDIPELAPVRELLPGHSYLGPVPWEPPTALPSWWDTLPKDRPVVYFSVGSSGSSRMLSAAVAALGDEPVTVMAACADEEVAANLPANFFTAKYLPGAAAAARAALVICNGGSGTVYQALSQGVPVLGIPSNADQHLAMHEVVRRGAAALVRSDALSPTRLKQTVTHVLREPRYAEQAQILRDLMRASDARARFMELLDRELPAPGFDAARRHAV